MEEKKSILQDKGFITGLVLIVISFAIHLFLYFSSEYSSLVFLENEGAFYINYIIAGAYFIGTVFLSMLKNWFKFSKYNYQKFICALILFSISCFTINIPFAVFSKFTTWVNIYLIVLHISLITLCFNDLLPKAVRVTNFFLLGLGLVICLYFTIYVLPLWIIAFFGIILFGLGLHLFVPAVMLSTIIYQFIKKAKSLPEKISFFSGIALPLIVIITYSTLLSNTKELIHATHASIITRPDNELPTWVLMSQELEQNYFTELIIKGDLIFETDIFGSSSFIDGGRNSLGETKKHDPLLVIGSQLMGDINLDRDDRIKILESKFDLRHQTKRKLWSGKHLTTSSVLSNIQVFPDYRLAYTEKIIRIKNNYEHRNWNRQEEALYTFHLPEGSVATSLSLWIEGKEEKSRLTTKSKADSAYVSIVGVERRDPAIMHWQEGNTITVYVFPCTPAEERMFKIGVTTPLKYENNNLVLQNVYFEGPDAADALETSVVEFKSSSAINPELPNYFEETIPNKFTYTGSYNSYWEASCNATPLSTEKFSFNGNSYHITEAQPKYKKTNIHSVYLDINKSWNKSEFEAVWKEVKDKKVFVYYDKLHQLNEGNKDKFFEVLNNLNFSLFPLQKINGVNSSLLISKSPIVSPTLMDLENSEHVENLKEYLGKRDTRINLFNLSNELSPYLRTLKEFQVFNYAEGNPSSLKNMLQKNVFVSDLRDENTVDLTVSKTQIIRDTNSTKSSAPDHLLRLFAYNKIMDDCGRNYFTASEYVQESLIGIANEAYIVSPISSLVVLETIKDYERFGIDENKNSLKNASTSSDGAVPEPHEWALIILLSATLAFLYYKRKINPTV